MKRDFQLFQQGLSQRWKSTMLFGRGEADIPGSLPATLENISTQLRAIAAHAKSGDQVLIYIMGHGFSRRPQEQRTHDLFIENNKRLDLDFLEEVFEPMLKRTGGKVRLAVIDLSCFSGTTQLLAIDLPDTCVVSSITSKYEATTISRGIQSTFMDKFSQVEFTSPLSLEEHFMLNKADHFNFAQISSLDSIAVDWMAYWQMHTH